MTDAESNKFSRMLPLIAGLILGMGLGWIFSNQQAGTKIEQLQSELATAQTENATLDSKNSALNAKLEKNAAALQACQTSTKQAHSSCDKTLKELEPLLNELKVNNEFLIEHNDKLKTEIEYSIQRMTKLQGEIDQLSSGSKTHLNEVTELKAEKVKLESKIRKLSKKTLHDRPPKVVCEYGGEALTLAPWSDLEKIAVNQDSDFCKQYAGQTICAAIGIQENYCDGAKFISMPYYRY